jgi:MerR family redox-sensitive transcriptional activator SoxR
MAAAALSISELADRSGVSASALRFYEGKGLIHPERTSGNHRRYPRATLRRVAFIKAGVAAGVPLTQLRDSLRTLPTHRAPNAKDWEKLSRAWQADLDARITTLQALRDRLTGCIGCGCLSIDACQLLNPDDEASSAGAGPRYLKRASPREIAMPAR